MKKDTYVVLHHHRHGTDVGFVSTTKSIVCYDAEQLAESQGWHFEADRNETIEAFLVSVTDTVELD
jgi:hypothetical protein